MQHAVNTLNIGWEKLVFMEMKRLLKKHGESKCMTGGESGDIAEYLRRATPEFMPFARRLNLEELRISVTEGTIYGRNIRERET